MPPTWFVLWVCSGAMTFAIDLCAWYLRLSGALGPLVYRQARAYVTLNGGMRQLAISMLFANLLFPPILLACCLVTLYLDWRTFRLTRTNPR